MSQRKFFISYRRLDAPTAAHVVCERLTHKFGAEHVFFDVDSIPLGIDFHLFLTEQVQSCEVLVAVIGRQWLSIEDEQGRRRLDLEDDFVRIEIAAALERDIPVVPVLVEGATLPRADQLPECLRRLARRIAFDVRPGAMFNQHLDSLVQRLEQTLSVPGPRNWFPLGSAMVGRAPDSIITNSIGMKLAAIPFGSFKMGSPDDESGRFDNEGPQHEVQLTKGFHLGVSPVTQAEYQQVVGSNNPSHFTGDDRRPVENVSWFDAVEFCNRLSKREQLSPFYDIKGQEVRIIGGHGYRLPTEAEWEYACRAKTTTPWWFGPEESRLGEFAWYDQNSGGTTHPVGKKSANEWGLYDMHGNVWEWCQDWYGEYSSGSIIDPTGPASGPGRVWRGGSWYGIPRYCRSAIRDHYPPGYRYQVCGFRAART